MRKAVATFLLVFFIPFAPFAVAAAGPKIVVLGDSLSAGYDLPPGASFPEKLAKALAAEGIEAEIVGAGVSGDTSAGGLARLDWSTAEADGVIVELGGNDMLRGIAPEATQANIEEIVTRLKARGVHVLLAGMLSPPSMGEDYERAFNALYPQVAKEQDVMFYPFFLDGVAAEPSLNLADGIHPNEGGIDVIVSRILPSVKALVAASAKSK